MPARLLGALARDAAGGRCWLHVAAPAERPALERLLAAGVEEQAVDGAFQRELAGWVDQCRAGSLDGMVPGVYGAPTTVGPAEGEDLSVTLRLSQHRPDRASGGRPQGVGPRPNGRVMDGA